MSRPSNKGLSLGQTVVRLKEVSEDVGWYSPYVRSLAGGALYHITKLRKIIHRLESKRMKATATVGGKEGKHE